MYFPVMLHCLGIGKYCCKNINWDNKYRKLHGLGVIARALGLRDILATMMWKLYVRTKSYSVLCVRIEMLLLL